MPIDAEDAIEQAVFAALNVPSVTSLAAVYQHVPEDTQPPIVIIGDMNVTGDLGTKGDTDENVDIIITAIVRAEQRKPLLQIKRAVKAALNQLQATVDVWTLQFNYTGADGFLATDIPNTYVGNFHFNVLALS